MSMWFTKEEDGFKGWFAVKTNNGALRTGIPSGDFDATIVDPSDTNTSTSTVTESSVKGGLYTFDIPSSFLVTNGVGEYGVVIEIDTSGPNLRDVFSSVLKIFEYDFDNLVQSLIMADLTVDTGSTDTVIRTDATQADDFYNDQTLVIENSAGLVARRITDYANTNGEFTVDTAFPFTPANGNRAIVIGRVLDAGASLTPTAIANAVWEKDATTVVSGSFGELLKQVSNSVVSSELVAAAGSTTTEVRTNATEADNFYDGMTIVVINSAGVVSRTIESYANTNGAFTLFSALPFTPAASDRVLIINSSELVSNIFVNSNLIPALL